MFKKGIGVIVPLFDIFKRKGIHRFSLIYKGGNIHIYIIVLGQKRKQS